MVPNAHASLAVAAIAGILAVAAASNAAVLAGGLALLQLIFVMGGVRSSSQPSIRAVAWVALAAGWAALAWAYLDDTSELTGPAAVLGATLVAVVVVQLGRRNGRPNLTSSLATSATAVVLTVLPVLWLNLRAVSDVGVHAVELGLLGVGVVALLDALPVSRAIRRVVGVILSAAAATALMLLISDLRDDVPPVSAVVVAAFAGLMAAVASAIVDRLEAEIPTVQESQVRVPDDRGEPDTIPGGIPAVSGTASSTPVAAVGPLRMTLPFIAAAPAVYVLGRILIELPS